MADTRATEFFNPESLKTNHWLHTWKVMSTSPYAPACVFSIVQPSVTTVAVSPSSASVYGGQKLQLSAAVTTAGFANKAVTWKAVDSTTTEPVEGVSIDVNGLLSIASDVANNTVLTVTATSVYNDQVSGTATITVVNAEQPTQVPTSPDTEAPTD